ncbi:MAG: tetratricopeptide repeat protein [Sedimentisphaerales bacterium]|nr:tetratricopeptide repeat protein [Sedimentisphaerales bacterium]
MLNWKRCAKINVKVLIILIIITVALGASLFAARHIRRSILSKIALEAGLEAYENENWQEAYENFMEYLGRNPNDIEILKKYATAGLSLQPLPLTTIGRVIASYRLIIRLNPQEESAYEKLAMLYPATGNYEELAYIANKRLEENPKDKKAPLWLAEALIQQNKIEEAENILKNFIDEFDKTSPNKQIEYIRACIQLSKVTVTLNVNAPEQTKNQARTKALEYLNNAVKYDPNSAEALAYRVAFYRETSHIPGTSTENRQEFVRLARKDLEAADTVGTKDPRVLLLLAGEWIGQGNLEQAAAKLNAAESLPKEKIKEVFLDLNNWNIAKYLMASEIAIRRGAKTECASLADEALATLKENRNRIKILPSAILLYVTAEKVSDAKKCIDELVELINTQKGQIDSTQSLAYLKALVAKAEGDWYVVIDTLQPTVMSDAMRPELWQLLAEAFSRTDQPRRAVSALIQYLRFRPQDRSMRQQLAKEYLKLQDWSNVLKTARLAESLNPTEIILKLLRIEANINIIAAQQEKTLAKRQALADEINELDKLREKHPQNVDIRILQAMISIYLEDPNTAERELKLAIDECEDSLRAEMQLSRFYYQNKRIDEAISTCKSACENHSEIAEPWLFLSSIYIAIKDYDSARSYFKQGMDNVVGKWEKRSILMSHALLELTYGDRASGINFLTQIALQDKREIRARILLLETREIQENKTKAQELIDELHKAEGESGLMWRLYQANMWLSSDEWRSKQQDIEGHLQRCIDSDPGWSKPSLVLAAMYEKLQDATTAENIYRQALTRNPFATDIVDKLVTLLEKQGRFSDAEKILQQNEINPKFSSARGTLLLLRAGEFSKAIDELKLRISNNAQDANSRILLARLIYWQDKNVDQAMAYLNEAEAISSGSIAITAARVSILRAEGKTEEAQQLLNNYVANSDVFGAYMMRAAYLANEGEFELAEQDYRKLTTFAEQGAIGYELLSNFYGKNQNIDKAVETLEEGLNAYPENLRLKRRLMKTLFLPGPTQNKQKALEILAALEKQTPQDPELMKYRALEILEKPTPQSLETARKKLENVIQIEPTAIDAHLVLIGIAMQEQDYNTARDYAIRAIGSNPDNLSLLAARSRAELALGNTSLAMELARLVIQKDQNNIEARDVFVTAALASNNRRYLEEADKLLESAIVNDPKNEQLLLSRSRILLAMGSPQNVIPELEAYCQTKEGSSSLNAIIRLVDLYRISNDMERAKQWIIQAEKIAPGDQFVIHARFLWLVAQNSFDELIGISSEYLTAKNKDPKTLLGAASILVGLNSTELKKEGLKLYEHASKISPELITERSNVASILYQKGDPEQAENIYRELLEKYPNNIRILNDLAWILQEHYRRYNVALDLANKALSISPDDINLLDTRGTILSNMPDRLQEAKNDFLKLVELSFSNTPQQAKALLQLGRICIKLNDIDNAKQYLNKAIQINRNIDVEIFTPEEQQEINDILQNNRTQTINN